jgi:hypothetical protein
MNLTNPERAKKLLSRAQERLRDFGQGNILNEYGGLMTAIAEAQKAGN